MLGSTIIDHDWTAIQFRSILQKSGHDLSPRLQTMRRFKAAKKPGPEKDSRDRLFASRSSVNTRLESLKKASVFAKPHCLGVVSNVA